MIMRLPNDNLISQSIYHVIPCSSHQTKVPITSITFAEIFTAGEAIDIGKLNVNTYRTVFNADIDLVTTADPTDLFTTRST